MEKKKVFIASVLLLLLTSVFNSNAATPNVKLVATDSKGMKFTIEVFESTANNNSIDLIIYKNSDPKTKVYDTGTDLHRGFYYVNTDTPLFDIAFPKGAYKTQQPFKKIFEIYYGEGDFFIAPTDTKDPGWRIPYVLDKSNGRKENGVDKDVASLSNLASLKVDDFVEVRDGLGPFIKNTKDLAKQLKSLGFTVHTYNAPSNAVDEMAEYIELRAKHDTSTASTIITLKRDEDRLLTIEFPDEREVQTFLKSIIDQGYTKEGEIYFHPECNLGKVGVKIKGKEVKILQPFEMFPNDF